MPGVNSMPREKQNRNPRPHGFARQRMTPAQRVEHVLEECPGCGTGLSGGWTQRTREVIDLPLVPVQVTEHVYVARTCPLCQRRCVPGATAGRGAGKAASGGQPGQPDCCPQGGGPAALAHHPVVLGHGARAAPQPGGPGGRCRQSLAEPRANWRALWNASGAVRWSTPITRATL